MRNAKSAPAADFAALLEDTNGPMENLSQNVDKQSKVKMDIKSSKMNVPKAAMQMMFLILFYTEEKHIQQQDLPPMTASFNQPNGENTLVQRWSALGNATRQHTTP